MQVPLDSLLAEGTDHYIEQFNRLESQLPGNEIGWVAERRRHSLAHFGRVGFPTQRDEDWRYTPLKPITGKSFDLVTSSNEQLDISQWLIEGLDCYRLVFIDGVLSKEQSDLGVLEEGVSIESLSFETEEQNAKLEKVLGSNADMELNGFTALNNAMFNDGVLISLKSATNLEKPLELLFVSNNENSFSQPKVLVVLSEHSNATIIERYVSSNEHSTFTNSATEVQLKEGAELDYYLVQTQSNRACQVSGISAQQEKQSRFSCHTVTLGGALVRNDLRTELKGPQAHCDMFGVYCIAGKQHVDNHTTMIHAAENCTSRELYKGVLDQRSRGVFHGRIKVESGAQKTDANQANNTLLLSRDAEIDTKPQLEIYADDVKCSHGATIGQIDENSLFYLRSRGIDSDDARSLLTYAFVNDVLAQVKIDPLKTSLEKILGEQLIREL